MLIGTLEALDRLPEGAQVDVDGHLWERVRGGLKREDEVLPLLSFAGFADARKIRTAGDPVFEFPTWRQDRRGHHFLLVDEDPISGGIVTLSFLSNGGGGVLVMTPSAAGALTVPPGVPTNSVDQWVARIGALVAHLRPASVFTGGAVPGGLLDDLYAMAPDMEGLDEVLVKHHVGRQRTGKVTVQAEGSSTLASGLLGDGIEVDEMAVPWRFGYQFPAQVPITEPCLCGAFDQGQYNSRLPVNVVTENHKVTCTEPDCVNKEKKP